MHKSILTAALLSLFAIGCGNPEAENAAKEEAKAEQELMTLDSATAVMENVTEDIKASTEKADALLNDL
jgi:hypothetical protein|tara:strand:+ start:677 stop:883 length:207 start_codon:yes stop_codon:yes gene_type:complete